jgi:hypothetical protein
VDSADDDRWRAALVLAAACDTTLRVFSSDDIDDLSIAVRIAELRDVLHSYLEARRAVEPGGG